MNIESNFINTAKYQANEFKNIDTKNIKTDDALKKVCDDFESFFTQQLLDISLRTTNVAGEGTGSEIIKGMYTESIAKNSTGTFGISDILYKFLSEKNK